MVAISVATALQQPSAAELSLHAPARGVVYQRDRSDKASVPVAGTCSMSAKRVQARATVLDPSGKSADWTDVDVAAARGSFSGHLNLRAGWYELQVREQVDTELFEAPVTAYPVGVGEVFIVVGHSVAQGGTINVEGASDPRARTIDLNSQEPEKLKEYELRADPKLMPALAGVQFSHGVRPAPLDTAPTFGQDSRRRSSPVKRCQC